MSFNPRTHTGCDVSTLATRYKTGSFNPRTHTGCDLQRYTLKFLLYVSIHAPTRGATSTAQSIFGCSLSFNPRTHTGCDRLEQTSKRSSSVSIHAPTRGATRNLSPGRQSCKFQSTHPHGVRQAAKVATPRENGFNPRTHTGCDLRRLTPPLLLVCFNPRTHTGCDTWSRCARNCCKCFNPRTHTGCDCIFSKCLNINLIR